MAQVNRTLDVDELQILVRYEGDAQGLEYHRRILFLRASPGRWIIGTPGGGRI